MNIICYFAKTKVKGEKNMKNIGEKLLKKSKTSGNKRNNLNSTSSNDNTTNNPSNSKYKCSVWGKRLNKKSRTIK